MTALIAAIHHGSPFEPDESSRSGTSRLHDLDQQVQVGGVLVGDARDALDQLAVDARPQLDRGAVRADDDRVAGRDRAPRGIGRRAARARPAAAGTASSGTRSTNGPEKSGR